MEKQTGKTKKIEDADIHPSIPQEVTGQYDRSDDSFAWKIYIASARNNETQKEKVSQITKILESFIGPSNEQSGSWRGGPQEYLKEKPNLNHKVQLNKEQTNTCWIWRSKVS